MGDQWWEVGRLFLRDILLQKRQNLYLITTVLMKYKSTPTAYTCNTKQSTVTTCYNGVCPMGYHGKIQFNFLYHIDPRLLVMTARRCIHFKQPLITVCSSCHFCNLDFNFLKYNTALRFTLPATGRKIPWCFSKLK